MNYPNSTVVELLDHIKTRVAALENSVSDFNPDSNGVYHNTAALGSAVLTLCDELGIDVDKL